MATFIRLISLTVFFAIGLNLVAAATDYCSSSLCGTSTHIACNNDGSWSSNCPTSPAPKAITFTTAMKTRTLKIHNTRRNLIASGKLSGYKPAKRMATMRWNAELATLAALNVKQCQMSHDACHNTATFKASGQNLATYGYSGDVSAKTNMQLLVVSINMWWNEYKDANMTYINSYPSSYSGPAIGHFTAMVQEKNTHVGCAASRYTDSSFNWWLMACNYATTNYVNSPVYQRGTAGSGCTKGKNTNYTSLCKIAEVYDV